jgi:hypothetical protein
MSRCVKSTGRTSADIADLRLSPVVEFHEELDRGLTGLVRKKKSTPVGDPTGVLIGFVDNSG